MQRVVDITLAERNIILVVCGLNHTPVPIPFSTTVAPLCAALPREPLLPQGSILPSAFIIATGGNAFALVDDIFEPFRPLVDLRVKALWDEGKREVDHDTKTALVELNSLLLPTSFGASPLSLCIQRLAGSLARAFETGESALETVQFSVGDVVF